MELNLSGKTALITGGSHGIGKAIAKSLTKEGCNVVICARNKERLEEVEKEIRCVAICADCTVDSDIKKVAGYFDGKEIDILINNIGGGGRWGSDKKIHEFNEWQEVYDKNAGAAIKFTMALLPKMIKNNWGRVITIASVYGKEAGGKPWFNMANSSEVSLMKSLAISKEYPGITFNSIAPGEINIGRAYQGAGNPEDVANLTTFLCSEKAKHINGACITIDGGLMSKSF